MEGEMAAMDSELTEAHRRQRRERATEHAHADSLPPRQPSRTSSRPAPSVKSTPRSETESADGSSPDTGSATSAGASSPANHASRRSSTVFQSGSDNSSSESNGDDARISRRGSRAGGGKTRVGGGGDASVDVTSFRSRHSAPPAGTSAPSPGEPSNRPDDHEYDHAHGASPNLRTPQQQLQKASGRSAPSPRYPINHYRNPNSPSYAPGGDSDADGRGGDRGTGGGGDQAGADPRLSTVATHAPKLVSLGAAGDRSGLLALFTTVAQDLIDGGGGRGGGLRAEVVVGEARHRRGDVLQLPIHHAQSGGAPVACLIVSTERSANTADRDLDGPDREVLQSWCAFLGGCLHMVASLEGAAEGMRNASNAVKAMQLQAQRAQHANGSLADSVTSRLRAEALLTTTQQIYNWQYQVRLAVARVCRA